MNAMATKGGVVNWMHFFESSFHNMRQRLNIVLDASGCREGWLQGELFRLGKKQGLLANSYSFGRGQKADLSFGEPVSMVAEVKIVGAQDQAKKMKDRIESDVARLGAIKDPSIKRFMLLVVPDREDTELGRWLLSRSFSKRPSDCFERAWAGFRLRAWRIR
jgi:hypothetical protein